MSLDGQQASGGGTGPLAHCEASRRGGDGRGCEVSRVRRGGEVGLRVPAAWASSERGGTAVQASGALAPRVRVASRAVRPASHAWRRWRGDRSASGGWGRSGMVIRRGLPGDAAEAGQQADKIPRRYETGKSRLKPTTEPMKPKPRSSVSHFLCNRSVVTFSKTEVFPDRITKPNYWFNRMPSL